MSFRSSMSTGLIFVGLLGVVLCACGVGTVQPPPKQVKDTLVYCGPPPESADAGVTAPFTVSTGPYSGVYYEWWCVAPVGTSKEYLIDLKNDINMFNVIAEDQVATAVSLGTGGPPVGAIMPAGNGSLPGTTTEPISNYATPEADGITYLIVIGVRMEDRSTNGGLVAMDEAFSP